MASYTNRHIYNGIYDENASVNRDDEQKISVMEYIRKQLPRNMLTQPKMVLHETHGGGKGEADDRRQGHGYQMS